MTTPHDLIHIPYCGPLYRLRWSLPGNVARGYHITLSGRDADRWLRIFWSRFYIDIGLAGRWRRRAVDRPMAVYVDTLEYPRERAMFREVR